MHLHLMPAAGGGDRSADKWNDLQLQPYRDDTVKISGFLTEFAVRQTGRSDSGPEWRSESDNVPPIPREVSCMTLLARRISPVGIFLLVALTPNRCS